VEQFGRVVTEEPEATVSAAAAGNVQTEKGEEITA
jgi:hypothetical protein